jgi:hypothetical protein
VASFCQRGNEPSVSMEGKEFLAGLSDWLLREDGASPSGL